MTEFKNWYHFAEKFAYLAMAIDLVNIDGSERQTNLDDIFSAVMLESKQDLEQANFQLACCSVPQFWEIVKLENHESHPAAPTACKVLSSIYS